jgi:hypothetical protein
MNDVLSKKYPPNLTIDEFIPECKPFAEPYSCPLCEGILYESVIDKCGHSFCLECSNNLLKETQKCPFSNLALSPPFAMNIVVNTVLEKQIVFCRNKSLGCEWQGKLGDRKTHLNYECLKETISCEYAPDCKEKDLRENILNHIKTCPYRLVQCEYCDETMTFENLEYHNKVCPNIPVECSNKCGKKIPMNKLKYHLEEECDNTVVECPFNLVGCEYYEIRLKLKPHLEQDLERHLRMLTDKIHKLEKGLNEANSRIDELNNENNLLKKNIQILNEQIINNKNEVNNSLNLITARMNFNKKYSPIYQSNFVPNFFDNDLSQENIFFLDKQNFIIKKSSKNLGWYGLSSKILFNVNNSISSSLIGYNDEQDIIIINMKINNTINSCIMFGITWSNEQNPVEKGFYSFTNDKNKSLMFYCFNSAIYHKGVVMVSNPKEKKCYDGEIITMIIKKSKNTVQFRKNGKPVFDAINIPELNQSLIRAAVDMSDFDDEVEFLR